jgi:hypothetical protein
MIDKKVVADREWEEYINKLYRTILELRRDDIGDLINDTTDYDEVRVGDNVILDFGETIIAAPKERLKDSMFNTYREWLKNRGPYDSDIDFEKKTFNENCKGKGFKEN